MASQHEQDKALEEQLAMVADFRTVFVESVQGQRVLAHLKRRFHFNTSTAAIDLQGNPLLVVDRDTQLVNEGQRSVLCYILGMTDMDAKEIKREFKEQARLMRSEEDMDDLGV